jgi:murein L,D-transpeptidase YafK
VKTVYLFLVFALIPFVCHAGEAVPEGVRADKVLIEKKAKRMSLISDGQVIKTYRIALGKCPEGPKLMQGDHKTPEGTYQIDSHYPLSEYHLALHISYPGPADRERAMETGVPAGGDIMIHGIKDGYGYLGDVQWMVNWTDGCIAVSNEEIEEIWRAVPDGTEVEIRP